MVITKGLIRKKQECQSQRGRCDYKKRHQNDATGGFGDTMVLWTMGCSQPLEVGQNKEWLLPGSLQKERNSINTVILV